MKKIYATWFYFCTALLFLILYIPFSIVFLNERTYWMGHRLRRIWGYALMVIGFIRWKTIYEFPLDKKKVYVIVSNHASYLDIISLSCLVPLDLNFIAKIELSRIPMFGIFFRTIDIAVDRKNPHHAGKGYKRAYDQLQEGKMSIALFAEGGIKSIAPKLSPFKDGPFKMAIETGVDILPVTLPDNWKRGPADTYAGTPGIMRAYIHKPISTKNLTVDDVPELKKKVFGIIHQQLVDAGAVS